MSKTKNNGPADADAVAEAESVLGKADPFLTALRSTHASIPAALAEEQQLSAQWGSAVIDGSGGVDQLHAQLGAARERRERDVRRRRAAIDNLLGMESELIGARAAAEQVRAQFASTVVNEFLGRWNHACRELAKLHAEAAALTAALGTRVTCPPPYSTTMNVVSSQPELRLSLPLEPPPVTLPALATVAGVLDRLDAALAMVGGIKQAQLLDARSYQLALQRGTPTEHGGVFRVIAEFVSPVDGLPFAPGALVDSSLVGHGHLARLSVSRRFVQPVELEIAAA
jgi:hypothetical protein